MIDKIDLRFNEAALLSKTPFVLHFLLILCPILSVYFLTSFAGRLPSSILLKRSSSEHPLITSRGSMTLPRLFDIFRPYLSRTIACKYTGMGIQVHVCKCVFLYPRERVRVRRREKRRERGRESERESEGDRERERERKRQRERES